MALLCRTSYCGLPKIAGVIHSLPASFIQLRWRKIPRRKPRWLPTAPSKLYRIPVYQYVPPDEQELRDDLLDEYYRRIASLKKLFQDELKQKSEEEGTLHEKEQEEEAKFRLLLEENKKENERVGAKREQMMVKIFQENQLEILQLEDGRKTEEQRIKLQVEEIVRKEKEKAAAYINLDTLDDMIEKALDTPINRDFAIDVNGKVLWEGSPPTEFEEELRRKIDQSLES